MLSKVHVVVGLGNPGREYAMTRHNLGYLVVSELARSLSAKWKLEPRFESIHAEAQFEGMKVHLLLPLTYMNESGRAVAKFLSFYKLGAQALTVVVDDLALPFGQERVRLSGSSGGHNGLKSIQAALGTMEYRRLRLGIGPDTGVLKEEMVDFVLGQFTNEEKKALPEHIMRWVCCLKKLLGERNEGTKEAL